MRRFSPLLFILVLALILPSAALARTRSAAPAAAPRHAQVLVLPSALATAGRATGTISGTVLNFDGTPMVGAEVDWGYEQTPGSWISTFGSTYATTDTAGHFTLTGVLVTPAGTLDVYPPNSNEFFFRRVALNFVDGAAFTIRPAHITFITDHAAQGQPWTSVSFEAYGPDGMGATSFTGVSGDGSTVATSQVDHAVAYWFINEGKEVTLPAPIAVTAGALAATGITISEADSQFVAVLSPAWASGAPGTKVTLEVDNWVLPTTATFSFSSEKPAAAAMSATTAFAGTAYSQRTVTLTIPKAAPTGFGVQVHMDGTDAGTRLLDLYDRFQVCTLVGSKTSIAKGASVRLSGVIPANSVAKKVILYSRTTKATAQPSKWDATKAGWKKVATISAAKTGAFKSGLLKPTRTTWYVVRYPGDAQNSDAFTGVLKITVH